MSLAEAVPASDTEPISYQKHSFQRLSHNR